MANELGEVMAAATAVAISPVPIVVAILILFSSHARRNGIIYLLGWVLGLLIVIGAVLLLPADHSSTRSVALGQGGAIFRLLIGASFIVAAFAVWLRRPRTGEAHPLPAWTSHIEDCSAIQALILAVGLAVINPKNLAVAFSVVLTVATTGVDSRQAQLILALFVCLGSLTIAVPVFYRLVAGNSADHHLHEWKEWMVYNNATVMFVLLLMMGILILGKGLGGLL